MYLYIYHKDFFCLFRISGIRIFLKNQRMLEISYRCPTRGINTGKNNLSYLKSFLNQFYKYQFSKIKFAGKGFKIKKNNKNNLVLLFNRAHITNMWYKNLFIKKHKKYKIYLKYLNNNYGVISSILKIRTINIFTKKGLRSSRQIVFKKKGKK